MLNVIFLYENPFAMKRNIFFLLLIILTGINARSQSVTININGIRNYDGQLQIAVFENQQQFHDEEPVEKLNFAKSDISNGRKSIKINLKSGTYAITVLDDGDKSDDMTYRLGLYPKEGVGFSNYTLKGLKKPDFSDFDFAIDQNNKQVNVDIKYF